MQGRYDRSGAWARGCPIQGQRPLPYEAVLRDRTSRVRVPGKVVESMPDEKQEPKDKKIVVEVREIEKLEPTGRSPGVTSEDL